MRKDKSSLGLVLAGGILLGYVASLFIPDSIKNKNKKQIEAKAVKLKAILTDPEERQRIKEIFNDQSEKARAMYADAKDTLVTNLVALKGSLRDINKQKYLDAVNATITQLRSEKNLPAAQLTRLKEYLQTDYERVRAELNRRSVSSAGKNGPDLQG